MWSTQRRACGMGAGRAPAARRRLEASSMEDPSRLELGCCRALHLLSGTVTASTSIVTNKIVHNHAFEPQNLTFTKKRCIYI